MNFDSKDNSNRSLLDLVSSLPKKGLRAVIRKARNKPTNNDDLLVDALSSAYADQELEAAKAEAKAVKMEAAAKISREFAALRRAEAKRQTLEAIRDQVLAGMALEAKGNSSANSSSRRPANRSNNGSSNRRPANSSNSGSSSSNSSNGNRESKQREAKQAAGIASPASQLAQGVQAMDLDPPAAAQPAQGAQPMSFRDKYKNIIREAELVCRPGHSQPPIAAAETSLHQLPYVPYGPDLKDNKCTICMEPIEHDDVLVKIAGCPDKHALHSGCMLAQLSRYHYVEQTRPIQRDSDDQNWRQLIECNLCNPARVPVPVAASAV